MLTASALEVAAVALGTAVAAIVAMLLGHRQRRPEPRHPERIVVLAAAIAFLSWSGIALLKYRAYNMGSEDLGRVDQAVWSVLSGQPLVFSASEVSRPMSRMAGHVELLYLPLAPLFLLWDSAAAILIAQALLVAFGAWPAYRLGQAHGGPTLGVASAIAWLAHPAVGYATLSDVHGDTLSMTFLLLALERAFAGRRWHAIAAMAFAIAGKEYVAALAITAALLVLLARRERRIAAAWAAMGLSWLLVVVPALHQRHRPDDFPRLTPLYYQQLGQTPGEVVWNSVRRPGTLLAMVATPRNLGVMAMLLAPFAWAPLAAPLPLLAVAPVLIPLAASGHLDLRNHHNATLIPFLLLASVLGARRLAGERAAIVLLAATAVAHITIAPSPLSIRSWTPGRWDFLGNPHIAGRNRHHEILDEAVAMVPRDARVTASGNLVPHLSHREVCFTFPGPRDYSQIDFALVDLAGPWPPSWRPRSEEIAGLRRLLADRDFHIRFARDGVFVIARGAPPPLAAAPPCAQPGRLSTAGVSLGPLLLSVNDDGGLLWTASKAIDGPLLVLDADSREVWLTPSAPFGPETFASNQQLRDPLGCWPRPGQRLRVLRLQPGYPALDWPGPPEPWRPDTSMGERQF